VHDRERAGRSIVARNDTIIVGAGPAGLAVGAALRRKRIAFDMLERADQVGSSWRHHYDRLHLHTPKRLSALPFLAYPPSYPRYPSRDDVVAYLDDYAHAFAIAPELGVDVERIERRGDAWRLSTNRGTRSARRVVVATGFNRVPKRPTWPGLDVFRGRIVHASEYRNPSELGAERVLVVGFGNSGAEIALDLAEHGVDVALSVRGGVNVVPRDLLGIPVTYLSIVNSVLPPRIADRLTLRSIHFALGDIEALGLRKRATGPLESIRDARRIPVIDVGTIEAIRRGRIAVRAAISSSTEHRVRFADGVDEPFDAIVLATGYDGGLRSIFGDDAPFLDADGYPSLHAREAAPGLYFCGLHLVATGLLREIAIEAQKIATMIARDGRIGPQIR
jgi:cation diffusion facilitator CzcD-associated flavoprotein CzcO